MSTTTTLREVGLQIADSASLGDAFGTLLGTRTAAPILLGLGEPTHGIEAFPLLRNEILGHLVENGYRSVILETDFFAASIVDDYIAGGTAELDTVLATGFSHGFGSAPGNRELVEWLRAYNDGRAPRDRVRFYGFDGPVEYAGAPSPRAALARVIDYLPAGFRPASAHDIDDLLGPDADWTNPAAMYDPAASIGGSESARALRITADDLVSAVRRAAPVLRPADPDGYDTALAHARTALALLRYHAAMAEPGPDRISLLLSLRAEMMADNLSAITAREQERGPGLVFAHNSHLRHGSDEASWANAGALVGLALAERYLFVATDATLDCTPGTLQHALAEATDQRALFPAAAVRSALPASTGTAKPIVPGHIPLNPGDLDGTEAVIFLTGVDGTQHQYW
ncbi:erythromycin esterase family protein [Nocardia sp. NBC_00511]|uniref:erythromycin esterase family protein n=1 Tax=Nocardia sp. NBC_00511 TaxID=2903591 RepID=UPI0030E063D2